MAKDERLIRRGDSFYYQRRVPVDLVSAIGKKVIKQSLNTKDRVEARKLREIYDVKWSAQFEQLRQLPPPKIQNLQPTINMPSPEELVRKYVERKLKVFEARIIQDPPENEEQRNEMISNAEFEALQVKKETPQGIEWISDALEAIEKESGQNIPSAKTADFLFHLVKRALIEIGTVQAQRIAGNYEKSHFDILFDPTKPNALTFGQLAAEYLEKKKQSGKINKRALKTLDKFDQNVALVRELIGENTAVANVDFDLCEEIRFKLAKVPANRTKLYKDTSINDMILRAADEGRHLLSSRTQAQYLDTLKSILDLACKKKLLDSNPATSMKPVKEDKISAQQKRLPFSSKQLKSFFGSQFYLRCMPNAEHPYLEDDKTWRFWLPLIALFTGMRANEICQLMTSDISTTAAGTPVINVNANVEIDVKTGKPMPKSVKNESSKRRIPVHQELVNLGFLKFVDSVRVKHENVRLFPTLKGGKYGHVSKYPTRRFNETYLRQDMGLEGRQSFHSFRHSFRDALRLIDASADTLEALGGWSQGKLVSSTYGTVSHPDHQSKIMNKIHYQGLNLSSLYTIDWAKN